MAKKKIPAIKTMDNSQLLELIDDQIYKHLPISKITEMINNAIENYSKSKKGKAAWVKQVHGF